MNSKLIENLSIYSTKIASQKHIMAIRDAFATTIPITIVAAFFLLVNNVLLNQDTGLLRSMPGVDFISAVGVQAYNGTLGILGLLVTFLIGYRLAKSYGMEGSLEAIVAVASYIALVPDKVLVGTADGDVTAFGTLTQNYTSASGMFLGIIAALLSVTLLCKLATTKRLLINMPESVPPAIAKSFNLLIPSFLTISIFAIAEGIIRGLAGMSVPDLVVKVLQTPLVGGFQTLPGILLYVFLATFVFIFGIHGAFVFGAISGPILLASLQQNIDAINAGQAAPNIVTQPFLDAYVYMGGGGTMICLVIALLLFSKKDEERLIAKLGGVPSLFNISEPIMFGLPIVFNPIYAVPFCIVPVVSTIIAYTATALNFVPPTYILVPWVTPPILSGYLATAGDFRASLLQIVIIAVGIAIYTPFVLISNRVKEK